MLLPLAERMVAKYVKENKIEAEAGKFQSSFGYWNSSMRIDKESLTSSENQQCIHYHHYIESQGYSWKEIPKIIFPLILVFATSNELGFRDF